MSTDIELDFTPIYGGFTLKQLKAEQWRLKGVVADRERRRAIAEEQQKSSDPETRERGREAAIRLDKVLTLRKAKLEQVEQLIEEKEPAPKAEK